MTQTATPATIKFHTEPCTRCNGEGTIAQYRHIDGGRCAKCLGSTRQLSRKGRAAKRAYDQALTDRLGRRADQIEPGQAIRETTGDICRVDRIETEGGTLWFVTEHANGHDKTGRPAHRIVRLADPAAEAEIAEQIAASCPGASIG